MAMIGRRAAPTKLNASDISDNAITSAHIQADALTHGDLAPNSITASELADNAVDTAAIAADAVDGTKIADDAVTGAKLANDIAITTTGALTGTTGDFNWDSNTLVVDSSASSVGIGSTDTQGAKLAIKSAAYGGSGPHASADEFTIEGSADSGMTIFSGTSSAGRIRFGDSGDNAIGNIKYDHSANLLGIGANGGDAHLVVASTGNVGIGESAPSGKFHVVNGSGITLPTLEASARNMGIFEGDNAENYIVTACPNDSTVGLIFADPDHKAAGAVVYAHGDNHMRFVTSTSERMRIDSSGKVGIGTAAPADQLHAIGTARINESTTLGHATNAGTALEIRGNALSSGSTDIDAFKALKLATNDASDYGPQAQFSVGRWEESGSYARSSLVMSLGHGGLNSSTNADVDVMTLRSDGRVGIGTVAPSKLLSLKANNLTAIDFPLKLENSGAGSTLANSFTAIQFAVGDANAGPSESAHIGAGQVGESGSWSADSRLMFWVGNAGPTVSNAKIVIDGTGHITPGGDNTQDCGSSGKRWRNVYSGDLQLSNEGTDGNEVDGTTGEWTIQEGDENLFVLNRKTGKKFKMNLTEV